MTGKRWILGRTFGNLIALLVDEDWDDEDEVFTVYAHAGYAVREDCKPFPQFELAELLGLAGPWQERAKSYVGFAELSAEIQGQFDEALGGAKAKVEERRKQAQSPIVTPDAQEIVDFKRRANGAP